MDRESGLASLLPASSCPVVPGAWADAGLRRRAVGGVGTQLVGVNSNCLSRQLPAARGTIGAYLEPCHRGAVLPRLAGPHVLRAGVAVRGAGRTRQRALGHRGVRSIGRRVCDRPSPVPGRDRVGRPSGVAVPVVDPDVWTCSSAGPCRHRGLRLCGRGRREVHAPYVGSAAVRRADQLRPLPVAPAVGVGRAARDSRSPVVPRCRSVVAIPRAAAASQSSGT